jgi:hypothetical protein
VKKASNQLGANSTNSSKNLNPAELLLCNISLLSLKKIEISTILSCCFSTIRIYYDSSGSRSGRGGEIFY